MLLTPSAARFLAGQAAEQPSLASIAAMPGVDGVYGDSDEWREPWTRGAAILHIELRRWADLLVIAPLGANTLAKIVGGMADGILTSVVRAWDARGELDSDVLALRPDAAAAADGVSIPGEAEAPTTGAGATAEVTGTPRRTKKKRIIVAPAMNVAMWRHPVGPFLSFFSCSRVLFSFFFFSFFSIQFPSLDSSVGWRERAPPGY